MLRLPKAVNKYKIAVSINDNLAMQIKHFLPFLFHQEGFFYKIKHWYLPVACWGFRCIYIEVAAFFTVICSVVVIDQSVIDINNAFFQINITPS
jgi:hypothetical protein